MGAKILFIRFSSLGDIVLTEPAVRYAKTLYPDSEIHYLTKPIYAQMVSDFEGVDKVYEWRDKINLFKTLRAEDYDYIVDLQSKFNSLLVKLLVNAKKTITYEKQHLLRQMIVRKLTKRSIDSVVFNYIKAVEAVSKVGAKNLSPLQETSDKKYTSTKLSTINYQLSSKASVSEIFTNYHIPTDKYLIGIFPGASHPTKQYPLERFVNFLLDIPDDWQCAIIVLGDWRDKYLALKIRSLTGMDIYDLTGAFDIPQLISAVERLHIVISNDSGPMHIAAALEKPQIAIFGATHTKLGFRPLNDKAVILQKDLPCQPCSLHGGKYCPKTHFNCMRQISSGELFQTFKTMFERVVLDVSSETNTMQ